MGVALSNLEDAGPGQLVLDDRTATLDATLDDLRERFGTDAITRAVLLDHEEGPRMPRLPDRRSGPAPAGLRPLGHVVDRAERVRDAVLAAVAHQDDLHVAERLAAVGAASIGP